MELDLFWTEFSQNELKKIYKYYKKKVNAKVAKKIVREIYNAPLHLKKGAEITQVEELLKDRKQEFRYLISTNYKIIYWINKHKNRIEIIDVFDTRQNPIKIKRTK